MRITKDLTSFNKAWDKIEKKEANFGKLTLSDEVRGKVIDKAIKEVCFRPHGFITINDEQFEWNGQLVPFAGKKPARDLVGYDYNYFESSVKLKGRALEFGCQWGPMASFYNSVGLDEGGNVIKTISRIVS